MRGVLIAAAAGSAVGYLIEWHVNKYQAALETPPSYLAPPASINRALLFGGAPAVVAFLVATKLKL